MILPTTIEPSTPEFSAICRTGDSSALSTMLMPAWTSELSLVILPTAFLARSSATPPPGTMPSSTVAPFPGRAGGVERVLGPILLLLPLDLGGAADADHRNAAREFGEPLLQLLTVVVRGGLLDLLLDLTDAGLDVLLLAGAVDDGRLLLLDDHLLGAAEHRGGHVLELDAKIFRDQLAAGEDRDVLEHGLAAVTQAPRPDRTDLEPAAQLVDHQRRQRLAFHVLGNDQQRLAGLHDGLEHRQHRLQPGQLLLVQQDEGIFELGHHLLGVGDEVGREIAAVELH